MKYDLGRATLVPIAIAAGVLAAGAAAADELYGPFATPHAEWSLFAGATRTDNATLTPGGPSDTIAIAGLAGSLYRDTGRFMADLSGSAHYEEYLDHTYPGQTLGSAVGAAAYSFVPERFVWVIQDTYGQATLDPLRPTTPTNRINANYVSTGPDADLRLGGTVDLLLGARYARADFESNPLAQVSNNSLTGKLGLRTAFSPTSSASLNASVSRVEYQAPTNPRYDQTDLYARFESRTTRGGVGLDAGVSEVRNQGVTSHDPLVRLTLFHRLTPSWNVNLSAGSQLQNSGQALQSAFGGARVVNGQLAGGASGSSGDLPGNAPADINLSLAPFRSEFARLSFDFIRPRTTLDISADAERQRYQAGASNLDRDIVGAGAVFTRRLRPTLDFHLSGTFERRTPLAVLPADRTTTGIAGFDWRVGAILAITLEYSHEARTTDAGGFAYQINRASLLFVYGPPKRRVAFALPGATIPSATPQ